MATYDVTGRVIHNGTTYEVGDSFDSNDDKVIKDLKEAGVLGRKLADVTVEAEEVKVKSEDKDLKPQAKK